MWGRSICRFNFPLPGFWRYNLRNSSVQAIILAIMCAPCENSSGSKAEDVYAGTEPIAA
jgi:hypothetical protein